MSVETTASSNQPMVRRGPDKARRVDRHRPLERETRDGQVAIAGHGRRHRVEAARLAEAHLGPE